MNNDEMKPYGCEAILRISLGESGNLIVHNQDVIDRALHRVIESAKEHGQDVSKPIVYKLYVVRIPEKMYMPVFNKTELERSPDPIPDDNMYFIPIVT